MLSMMQKLSCCKAPSVHSGYMRTPTSEVATNLDAADTGLWRKVVYSLAVTFWISMWYVVSILLTLFNKWLFAGFGLELPLLTTSLHFGMKALLSRLAMRLNGLPQLSFDCRQPMARALVLTGFATAADVACSNQAFLYLSVTSYTIIKSSVPVWILAFSVCLGLRKFEVRVLLVLFMILGGISLTYVHPHGSAAAPEADYNTAAIIEVPAAPTTEAAAVTANSSHAAVPAASSVPTGSFRGDGYNGEDSTSDSMRVMGFGLVLAASLSAGFRWACSQLLLSGGGRPSSRDGTHLGGSDGGGGDEGGDGGRAELAADTAVIKDDPVIDPGGRGDSAGGANTEHAAEPPPASHVGALHPYSLVFGTSSCGLIVLLPAALYFERARLREYDEDFFAADPSLALTCLAFSAVGGVLAFVLLFAEVRVVALTSGLSLSVAGVFKEVLTVLASSLFLGETLSPDKAVGLALCICGLALYVAMSFAGGPPRS